MNVEVETSGESERQITLDEILEQLRQKFNSQQVLAISEPDRLRAFLTTMMVNAIRAPDSITPKTVAFLADAGLKGFTVQRAITKLQENDLSMENVWSSKVLDRMVEVFEQNRDKHGLRETLMAVVNCATDATL